MKTKTMQNKNRILFDLDQSFVYLWLRVFPDYLSIPICICIGQDDISNDVAWKMPWKM